MDIILIRHGEAEQIGTDPCLTNRGKIQAQQLAVALNKIPITKAYVSDLVRALKTFEEYQKLSPEVPTTITGMLREIYSVIVGGPPKEGTAPYREIVDKTRIESFWKDLLRSKDKTIAIFTHGNVIRYILSNVMNSEPKKAWTALTIDCGSISMIEKNGYLIQVKSINDTTHIIG